jgi:hypothetical protein
MPYRASLLAVLVVVNAAACSERTESCAPVAKAEESAASTAVSASLVTEIHAVGDLVAGVPAGGDLATQELIRTIERTAAADGWTDHHSAAMKAQGESIVSRATREFQRALAAYLSGLRASVASR